MASDGERGVPAKRGVPASDGQSGAGASAHLGPRKLTTLHAVGQALAIGPVFSVGLVSGLVANVAGYSTPRPEWYGASARLEMTPSSPSAQALSRNRPASAKCSL